MRAYRPAMADTRFSLAAAAGCLLVSVLAAVQSVWFVAGAFGLLAVGFVARAADSRRRSRRG
jgi:hypothetical protein